MSKIGKMPIELNSAVKVTVEGNKVMLKGGKLEYVHEVPSVLEVTKQDNTLQLGLKIKSRKNKMLWGLHRALLANKIKGVQAGFEQQVNIVGLGYKAQPAGKKLVFSLGYSHKVEYELPNEVTVEVDKTGQLLTFKSSDKLLLGNVCFAIRSLKPPEPYKGTGVIRAGEKIIRKAGKAKAS